MKTFFFVLTLIWIGFVSPIFAQNPLRETPADSPLLFSPDPLQLDTLQQGTPQKVILRGKNTSQHSISLQNVLCQNGHSEDFVYPQQIAPQQNFQISYQLNTQDMEGPFTHRIVLVETSGKPWVTLVEGVVASPVMFSQKILDAGYHTAGQTHTWTFYAWNPQGKPLTLQLKSNPSHLHLKTQKVMLNTTQFDAIQEGGSTPGLKITLMAQSIPPNKLAHMKSIRHIVSFQSPQWPQAQPEVLIVGYWR